MPQIDETFTEMIKHFLRKEEGWGISRFEPDNYQMLIYDVPKSMLCLTLAKPISDDDWVDIKLNKQENDRTVFDSDLFEEKYSVNIELIEMFKQKYADLLRYNKHDFGSLRNIFKPLWESLIRYINQ